MAKRISVLRYQLYPPGVIPFGPVSLVPLVRPAFLSIELDRRNWLDPTTTVFVKLDISLDDGATWKDLCSMKASGGFTDNPRDPVTPTSISTMRVLLSPASVLLRGTVNVAGGSVQTMVTMVQD